MTYSAAVSDYITSSYLAAALTIRHGYIGDQFGQEQAKKTTASLRSACPDVDFDALDAESVKIVDAENDARHEADLRARRAWSREYNYLVKRDMHRNPLDRV